MEDLPIIQIKYSKSRNKNQKLELRNTLKYICPNLISNTELTY